MHSSMEILRYTDLFAAILNAAIVGVIVVLGRRWRLLRSSLLWALVVYFTLRILSRLNDSPDVLLRDDPGIELVLDLLSVAALVFLLSQVPKIARGIAATVDEARFRADEYERARRHYTQVVRHRVLNPVTVVKASAQTLKAGVVVDDAAREQICDAIIDKAEEIENLSLEPERRDSLEHDLDAIPNVTSGPGEQQ